MSLVEIGIAGILALPSLLVSLVSALVIGVLSIPAVYFLLTRKVDISKGGLKNNDNNNKNTTTGPTIKQVVVTGGSSGMGLEVAKEAARKGGIDKIYIIARNTERLEAAKKCIIAIAESNNNTTVQVEALSVDVTSNKAIVDAAKTIMGVVKTVLDEKNSTAAPVVTTNLFCCAGEPSPLYHKDVTAEIYTNMVAVNQLGSIYTANAFLPYFKEYDAIGGGGTITFCSSMAGFVGAFGYTAYCPSKFAIRGFAECLYIEYIHYTNIHIQIAYPPDTQTPGFDKENLTKPVECQLISEGGGVMSAEKVGKTMFTEATKKVPTYAVYFNDEGFLVSTLCAGFGPVNSLLDAVAQISMPSLFRYVSLFYYASWRSIIYNYKTKSPEEQRKVEERLFPDRKIVIDQPDKTDKTE